MGRRTKDPGEKWDVKTEQFESVVDLYRAVKGRQPNRVFNGKTLSSRSSDKRWTGTNSFEHATELLLDGWREPLEDIKKDVATFDKMDKTTPMNKVQIRKNIVGCAPCVPRAIMDLPDSMYMYHREPMKARTICLLYDVCDSGMFGADEMQRAGIALLKGISMLERRGWRVKLNMCIGFYEGNEMVMAKAAMKDYRQPLDLLKLAFPIANPSMLRRIGFGWLETYPHLQSPHFINGYGYPLRLIDKKDLPPRLFAKDETLVQVQDFRDNGYDHVQTLDALGIIKKAEHGNV